LAYFTARAVMLRTWLDSHTAVGDADAAGGPTEFSIPHQVEVHAALQGSGPAPNLPQLDVEEQVALDAFSLRHQAAEALARLAVAALERDQGAKTSLWSTVADGPHQIPDLAKRLAELHVAMEPTQTAALFLPPNLGQDAYSRAGVQRAVETFALWLARAMSILMPAPIDLHSANNKTKHGLAIRARADMRVDFTTMSPGEDGTVPLEAFDEENGFTIFDRPVLEFLSRRRKSAGLAVTQLRLDAPSLLVESYMLALTHAALFHVQAARHFADHEPPGGTTMAPYPGLAVGAPRPTDWSEKGLVVAAHEVVVTALR
jgi:hypothetical protein